MRLPLLVLAISALMLVPSTALAVHGSPYVARGVATLCDQTTPFGPFAVPNPTSCDSRVLFAEVRWTGWWPGEFVVTITDMDTNVIVNKDTFRGYESWAGPIYFNTEFFTYHGWADSAFGGSSHFDITGIQFIQINTGVLTMAYTGHYEDYKLTLFV